MGKEPSSIVALAGRRIDAPGASKPRFPLTQVDSVRGQIEGLFRRDRVNTLICSAACGADLIALRVAQELGIGYQVILPFAPDRFRVTSVIDRPASQEWNWGVLFDQVIDGAQKCGELVVVETGEDSQAGYQAVNRAILDAALRQEQDQGQKFSPLPKSAQRPHQVQALIVWDGHARSPHDLTLHFAEEARSRGLVVRQILTLS
jgi:hypothetical protein